MGFFTDILNGGRNQDPRQAANQYLNQIPGKANEGPDQAQSFVDKIMQSYKPSAGYNFQKEELNKELGNTAAAGGYLGGEFDQDKRGKMIQRLLSGDMQQYFNNVEGVHNRTNDIGINALNQQGGLAFGSAENNNSRKAALRDVLMKLIGGAGGAALGGPAGAQIGGAIGGALGGGGNQSSGWGQEALFGNGGAQYGQRPINAMGGNTPGANIGGNY